MLLRSSSATAFKVHLLYIGSPWGNTWQQFHGWLSAVILAGLGPLDIQLQIEVVELGRLCEGSPTALAPLPFCVAVAAGGNGRFAGQPDGRLTCGAGGCVERLPVYTRTLILVNAYFGPVIDVGAYARHARAGAAEWLGLLHLGHEYPWTLDPANEWNHFPGGQAALRADYAEVGPHTRARARAHTHRADTASGE